MQFAWGIHSRNLCCWMFLSSRDICNYIYISGYVVGNWQIILLVLTMWSAFFFQLVYYLQYTYIVCIPIIILWKPWRVWLQVPWSMVLRKWKSTFGALLCETIPHFICNHWEREIKLLFFPFWISVTKFRRWKSVLLCEFVLFFLLFCSFLDFFVLFVF